jgi:hypothetical protein
LSSGPHEIRGKVIEPKRVKIRPICKKIFVGGVDSNLDEQEIKYYFSKYGPVEGIELPYDYQRQRRREFCFVIFETEEAADAACYESKQYLGGKECDIKKAQPQPIAQEQKRLALIQPTDFHRKKTPKERTPQVNRNEAPSVVHQATFPYNGFIAPNIATGYNPPAQPINGYYGPQPSYFNYAQHPFEMYQFPNYAPHGLTSYEYFYAQQLALQQAAASQANASGPQQMIQIAGAASGNPNVVSTPVSGPITYGPAFAILDQQHVHPQQPQINHPPTQPSHVPMISQMVHPLHQAPPHILAHPHHPPTSAEMLSYQTDTNPSDESAYLEMTNDPQSQASINGNMNLKMIPSRRPLHHNYHGYKSNLSQQ